MKTLSELRKSQKLSQSDLAKLIGISSSAIAMYETKKRSPNLQIAKKIASYFKMPVDLIEFHSKGREA